MPHDAAIFNCPCCGKKVGVYLRGNEAVIRRHGIHEATTGCVFSGAKKLVPLRFDNRILRHNIKAERRDGKQP